MFSYYGGKGRIAKWYPPPRYPIVVEPFAGAAWYSITHHLHKPTLLFDIDPVLAAVWSWLITEATGDSISNLPPYTPGQPMARLSPPALDYYYRFRGNQGTEKPRNYPGTFQTPACDATQIKRLAGVKPWHFTHGTYANAPDIEATWFIDPPYQRQSRYVYNSVDYGALARWVQSRRGQVIVCEAGSADWLPFRPLRQAPGQTNGRGKLRAEVVWTSDDDGAMRGLL